MPALWKLTCFLVITMCVSALGPRPVARSTRPFCEEPNLDIFQQRDVNVTIGKRAVVKVAEVPRFVGIVQSRDCCINQTAVADFANESNVDIATRGDVINGSEHIVVNISEVTEEFRGVSIICGIRIRIRSRPIRVYKVNLKVTNEDCPREGLTNSSDVKVDPDKPSYGSGEEIEYGCDEDSWTVIGPSTRTCQGPEWHPPLSRNTLCLGLLAAPGNVSVEANDTVIFLNWSSPLKFTHGISNEHPDISNYTVYIHNIATNKSGRRIVANPSLIFSGLQGEDDPNPCYNYSFIVSAYNAVGKGERSEEVIQHFEGECQTGTEDKRLLLLLVLVGVVVVVVIILLCVIRFAPWKKCGPSKKGSVSHVDVGNTDGVPLETNGTHNFCQKNGNRAQAPTLGGPPPPPQMQRKGVSGHGLRRRRQKDYLRSKPELSDFMERVATKSKKWRELGLQLGLSPTALNTIADKATSLEKRFTAVFEELRKKSVTWEKIVQALKSPQVGETTLAGSLKNTLTYY